MQSWQMAVLALAAVYLCSQVDFVQGLECYVCSNQTGNTEKCLNTIKTCEPFENVCGTEIRWGSQPYFSEGALKQYYVSKHCMTKEQCQSKRRRYMQMFCTHIWYEDWACNECCKGDRCNYFVISGARQTQGHLLTVLATLLGLGLFIRRGLAL